MGACRTLKHLDLSGCEKITNSTLRILSLGLGDLATPRFSKDNPDCRSKLLKTLPSAIRLLGKHSGYSLGRARTALVFKWRPGGQSMSCSPVWVLDPAQLADIEDAADLTRRAGVAEHNQEHVGILGVQAGGKPCCCRRSMRRSFRTDIGSTYLQQLYGSLGEMQCGHSACCGSDAALRTVKGAQCEPQAAGGSTDLWIKCPSEGESRTDRSGACRALKFLSLSGCYQITDLGLRYCKHTHTHTPVILFYSVTACNGIHISYLKNQPSFLNITKKLMILFVWKKPIMSP